MRIYTVIIGLLVCSLVYSQEIDVAKEHREIDSLKTILTDVNVAENRQNYIRIIIFYARRNIDSSKVYVEKYAKLTEGSIMYFDAITRKIYILQLEKKYDEATALINETIEKDSITLNKPKNKYALLKFYGALAEIYYDQRAFEKALEIYYKMVPIYENEVVKDEINYYLTLLNISDILSLIGYEKKGLEYCDKLETLLTEKIATIDKTYGNYYGITSLHIHNHINKASIHEKLNERSKAIIQVQKAETISIAEKYYNLLPKIYTTLSNMYIASKEYENAIQNGLKALELEKLYNYPEFKDTFLHAVGIGYLRLKEQEKAIPYLEKALEETNVETGKVPILNDLAKAYQELKNYKKANEVLLLHNKLKDSVYSQNQEKAIAEITEKYENDKKQKEITFLNTESELQQLEIEQQSYIIYGIIGLVLLLLILGIVGYKTRKQKQKLKDAILNLDKEKLQQQFLRTQLNPHFFFHALAAIEGYIYKEDKETATSFLQKFGSLMRNILESSDIDFIPLETDVDFIEKYLALQSLNNNANFTYKITLAEELNSSKIMIPPMLIQPFVENAILHGVSRVENGQITIDYCKKETDLIISISDNGKGIATLPKKSAMLHRSMSTDITKQRIENIQKVHGTKISYKVFSEENTTVIFIIPLKYGNFTID